MTRRALIAADALSALADSMRNAADPVSGATFAILVESDRKEAVEALRALPEPSADHPYPGLVLLVGANPSGDTETMARFISAGAGHAEDFEDYADALRVWDREQREIENGEKAGSE